MLPVLLTHGTLMTWLLLALSAIVIVVFIERLLHYHRAQINSMEFLNGVRDALEEAGLLEVPRLEDKLNLLATIAQIAPLMGLLGTVMGFMSMFNELQQSGAFATPDRLAGGIWGALISMAGGLAVAIPTYAGYNYLVSRVNSIVLDMEKASTEILNIVSGATNPNGL